MTLQRLLEPLEINHMRLKNRMMFPPMTTGYEARDGSITEQSINFYKRVAEGGAAYIVLGDVTPVHTISPTPKLVTDEQIPSFRALADALHEFDCKLGLQVFHPEYDTVAVAELFAKGDMMGARAKLHHDMAHYINEVSAERLGEILESIKALARRAALAGADAIEVHGDRLVGSLCSPLINERDDEYGGSFEHRTRFAREVVRAIREGSPDICIDYKLPIITENPQLGRGGLFIDEAVELAKLLVEDGVDTFHVGQANHTGNLNDTIPAMGTRPDCFMEEYSRRIKAVVPVPVSTVGAIPTAAEAERLIAEGACDYVGLGRPMLCDPDYANKVAAGEEDLIRPCIMCNRGCTDAIASRRFISCVLNAENGYEYQRVIKPAETSRRIAVIGAGPAGMEAARVAALRGHTVTLFEKAGELGGQLGIASVPPRKATMRRVAAWYERALQSAGVDVRLNSTVTAESLAAGGYDEVIVAVGGRNAAPPIPGLDLPHVMDAWSVLDGTVKPHGRTVIIGGGLVGAETAELIAGDDYGCEVTIVEMMGQIAAEESQTIKPVMMADFAEHGVTLKTNTKVDRITAESVEATETLNPPAPAGRPGAPGGAPGGRPAGPGAGASGSRPDAGAPGAGVRPGGPAAPGGAPGATPADAPEPETQAVSIPCDCVVLALGTAPVAFDTTSLEAAGIKVTLAGDCNGRAADINRAVEEGYLAAIAA
ncbi:bilirubin reductase, long form [Bifidobacterium oedipodis]|uniref:NADH oxidase n=1 Tax=Bifidobacterium oedipodis TaxID=2675322 RepID=A0A7Y0EQY9_9BIFI|nr:bilirubin reductase, long form [Bifidobacterium sp. DSM 109957]NMM94829.1 NADH oxidase [Bifidobacterium sp. DSM 109957]